MTELSTFLSRDRVDKILPLARQMHFALIAVPGSVSCSDLSDAISVFGITLFVSAATAHRKWVVTPQSNGCGVLCTQ